MRASALAAWWLGLVLLGGCETKTEATKEASEKDTAEDGADEDEDKSDKKKKKKKKSKDDDADEPEEKTGATTAAAVTPTAAPTAEPATPPPVEAKPATPVTSPELQTYKMEGFTKISDGCSEAFAVASTAPESVGPDYDWAWTKQAMLANQQYKVVESDPTGLGEVSFQLHRASSKFQNAWVLVARCNNGSTCNNLVAMLREITKSKSPQPFCKTLPMDISWATPVRPILRELGSPQNTLPGKSDAKGQCARLQACTVAMDPSKADSVNIGFDCQKAPHKVKRECAEKYPCQEVMTCLGS